MKTFISNFCRTRLGAFCAILLITAPVFVVPAFISGDLGGFLAMSIQIALIFMYSACKGTGLAEYGIQSPQSWRRTILLGVLYAVLGFFVFRLLLEPAIERFTGIARDLSRFNYLRGNFSGLMLFLLIIWVSAAFYEELYFRGFLVTAIADLFKRSRIGWIVGVALSAICFAFAHSYQSTSGILFTGAAAIYFSLIYFKHDRNLWIPIIAHGLSDTSAALLFYFGMYPNL